ncbi:MAG: S8 family serine peptidase [Pseudomonadota bacterium]
MVKAIHALALLLLAGTVQAVEIQPAEQAQPSIAFEDVSTDATVRGQTRTYVVQMRDKAGLVYEGGLQGFLATAPSDGERYDSTAAHVQQYTSHLINTHNDALASMGANDRKIYSYCHTMNGFAARLTPAEAAELQSHEDVVQIWADYSVEIETNSTSDFLGLNDGDKGLRARGGLKGENIVIGVLDTGAVQEHPSFADTVDGELVYKAPPESWTGICQEGEAWSADDCNNKLVGARWYVDGFLAGRGSVVEGEFLSPRDSSGHGTHTASTAGGNPVEADISGTPAGTISGMAPRARIAVYKVCWLSPGATNFSCFFSDSAAATDQAVADGVDVLNFSVGTAASFTDLQDLAFLNATNAGVFVARSGGNDGPGFATINAGEPWVTSVAASTTDGPALTLGAGINAPASVAGNYTAVEGAITQPLSVSGDITADVGVADPLDACAPLTNDLTGQIALIARGTCGFVAKVESAVVAGAVAVIIYSDDRPLTRLGGTATALTQSVPGVMIENAAGLALVAAAAGDTVNASLNNTTFVTTERTGNVMAGFSSRGPYSTIPGWISPDITAPGVQILAAYAPDQADGSEGGLYDYLSGTSMSGPHIAGLGALIKEGRPEWSPAQIKSAMMTTARQDVVKEDGVTPADPFDFGAGHVVPNDAVSPGLTYDAGSIDYLAASCGTATPVPGLTAADCDFIANGLGESTDPEDLNLPSIGMNGIPGTKTVTRTVTAVSDFNLKKGRKSYSSKKQKFTVEIDAPPGFSVSVSPTKLKLRPGESATYEITVASDGAAANEWAFGAITWKNKNSKGNDVRSPIAVNTVAFITEDLVTGEGADGSAQFDLTFGYTGEYTAQVHGINGPGVFAVTGLVDDADDSFAFSFSDPATFATIIDDTQPGTAFRQFRTYNEYTSGNDDLDLYLYYCPGGSCTQIASSARGGSDEFVNVTLPIPFDPVAFNPYVLFIHAFDTEAADANLFYFDQQFGIVNDNGNLTVSAPDAATAGETAPVTIEWTGLPTGPLNKQIGAISHSDATGIQNLTVIEIENDPGASICDFPGFCP